MANPVTSDTVGGDASESESRESVSEALQLVEQTQRALGRIRAQVDDIARLMTELAKINALFETVADRLADEVFRATDADLGPAKRAVLAPMVKDLAHLARQTAEGTRDIRKELRTYAVNASGAAVAVRQTEHALEGLWRVLKQLSERVVRPPPPPRAIEIETRPPAGPQMTVATLAKAVAAGVWNTDSSKSGGYKN